MRLSPSKTLTNVPVHPIVLTEAVKRKDVEWQKKVNHFLF